MKRKLDVNELAERIVKQATEEPPKEKKDDQTAGAPRKRPPARHEEAKLPMQTATYLPARSGTAKVLDMAFRLKPVRIVAWRLMRALPIGSAVRDMLGDAFDRDLLRVCQSPDASEFGRQFLRAWIVSSAIRAAQRAPQH